MMEVVVVENPAKKQKRMTKKRDSKKSRKSQKRIRKR